MATSRRMDMYCHPPTCGNSHLLLGVFLGPYAQEFVSRASARPEDLTTSEIGNPVAARTSLRTFSVSSSNLTVRVATTTSACITKCNTSVLDCKKSLRASAAASMRDVSSPSAPRIPQRSKRDGISQPRCRRDSVLPRPAPLTLPVGRSTSARVPLQLSVPAVSADSAEIASGRSPQ